LAGRARIDERVKDRVRCDGKFFRLGADKFFVKGVTYGPFAPGADGVSLPPPDRTRSDFALIRDMGANCVRIYHLPPRWFLDLAQEMELKVFLDIAWPKNLEFITDQTVAEQARQAVRHAARECGNHPAILALSVVNEVPPDLVRFSGREAIEQFIDELVVIAKAEAPSCLVTFANFPTTEYLQPRQPDFVCFNVYLHDEQAFRNYLARLQTVAGPKPLMLGEYGIDTMREHTPEDQARILTQHVRAVFDEGLAGTFIFSFTDDWFVHGYQIDDWAFGLVTRQRSPKPAYFAIQGAYHRAPHLADEALPMCSVVVCSYNGGATVESCLRSLERLNYPDYEVVFVDDGSTDHTQDILRRFPWVRNIKQTNMGLSHARNVGLHAARGQIVVYTDSDCEADEDWLYYLALSLTRSKHVGVGGPNLIPDEGSWIADGVGLSPGGPSHVMIDDRTAEHVPGCNMAFYAWALKQLNGFDPQFRKAGDDVDLIWRLQHQGWSMGFAPAAQVWHYRRNTVKAYLKQQRGYGEAEALLKYKHPDHFNTLGASHWRGKIYGGDEIGVKVGGDVVYHGLFGTGLFQTIYRQPASLTAAMLMSIEWHLLTIFVAFLGLAWFTLVWVAVAMALVPIALSVVAAVQSPMPRHRHWLSRPLIAYLHYRQPITRGWARYWVRLQQKVMKLEKEASGYRRPHRLPRDRRDPATLRYWSHNLDRLHLLDRIRAQMNESQWRVRLDSGWSNWDVEVYTSRYTKVQITTATEHHHGSGLLTRVRVRTHMSRFCSVLLAAVSLVCFLLLIYSTFWPFNRPAILLPLAIWTLFVINKRQVTNPVLGLIDLVAERAGFYPVRDDKEPRPGRA
jgi:GT2 family glycosyltransferase